jgi:hypothetical protein
MKDRDQAIGWALIPARQPGGGLNGQDFVSLSGGAGRVINPTPSPQGSLGAAQVPELQGGADQSDAGEAAKRLGAAVAKAVGADNVTGAS